MKIIITESQLNRLNEDITAGRMIVYHRTGKKGFNPSKNIADDGYIVSIGAHYGYGVYTTYDLESQMGDKMKNNYGNIIIESQIIDTSKFLIFNYDIAKKIYKSRYRFIDQLKQILGKKEWLKYKDNDPIRDIDDTLEEGNIKYTSNLAYDFYQEFYDSILQKLNGMIFTGGNDGNVLVSYNRRNIEPLRYSEDDGKTWTNIRNVKTYQRIKEPDDYKKDPEFQHLLNKIENEPNLGSYFIEEVPSKYYDYLLNYFSKKGDKLNDNESKIIDIIKLIKKFGDYDIFRILNNSKDKEQTAIEILEINGDSLTSYDIQLLLSYFTIPDNKSLINIDVLIIKIIDLKGDKFNFEGIRDLVQYSEDKDLIATKIIDIMSEKLDGDVIEILMSRSTDKELIATKIIEKKGKELQSMDIKNILQRAFYYNKKNNSLHYGHKNILTKIFEIKGDKLNYNDINEILMYPLNNNNDTLIKIIQIKGEKLIDREIYMLLNNSKDKELIKKTLLQNGVDYELINDVIIEDDLDTPLIPDNYQSMLNEIKRIKQIIR
jgi:hypothetical protein